ncbi:hypothetical protein PF011_g1862 [Phytophthora fragariae]|uniref:Uncharacterized protein n=1 Tax=Phytophthora fragariae TaxID=53985 RepID=A0A6A3MAW8_9STRA|nr:hypothetical protein PF011_g1862 [Phytophthora fragariae]KAE9358747.1 hypothetical protein PF008_g2542 [Phytophthora fragariae]
MHSALNDESGTKCHCILSTVAIQVGTSLIADARVHDICKLHSIPTSTRSTRTRPLRQHFFVLLFAAFAMVSNKTRKIAALTWISKLADRVTKNPAKLEKIAKNKKYRQWLQEDENPLTM